MWQQIKVARTFSFIFPLIFLLANVGQAAILYFGGRQIIDGTLTFGEWQKFSLYLVYVFFPLGQLGLIISQMSQASASANRVFEILDAKSDVADKPGAVTLPPVQGNVAFEHVTFRYFGGGDCPRPCLNDVTFEAQPGQTVALLGATGSGKSTIINLIPRFYDVSGGRITIDGHDVRDVTLESLRCRSASCSRRRRCSRARSATTSRSAGRREPGGDRGRGQGRGRTRLHHVVPAWAMTRRSASAASTLSGGQKQRVAIARALLLNPRILILDDSTSAVDSVTEYEIQQALDKLMAGDGRPHLVRHRAAHQHRAPGRPDPGARQGADRGPRHARGADRDSPLYAEIFASQLVEDAPVSRGSVGPSRREGDRLNVWT